VKPPKTRFHAGNQPSLKEENTMAKKYQDVDWYAPNPELDADITALVHSVTDGDVVTPLAKLGISPIKAMGRGVWFTEYCKTHPEYQAEVTKLSHEILGIPPSILTKENVFEPNVEIDAKMITLVEGGADTFRAGSIAAGFSDPELGAARVQWLNTFSTVHPEYKDAVIARAKEMAGEDGWARIGETAKAGVAKLAKDAELEKLNDIFQHFGDGKMRTDYAIGKSEKVKLGDESGLKLSLGDNDELKAIAALGVDPTPENLKLINDIADSAIEDGLLAQPYIHAGAVVVYKNDLAPGVSAKAVGFHQTKLAEMLKNPLGFTN